MQGHNNIYLKCEHLQKTGSFKIRGAANKIKNIIEHNNTKHIITASSGNHGKATAYIGKQLGINVTVIVPENATSAKTDAIKNYGGNIIYYGTTTEERLKKVEEIKDENSIAIFDDNLIMAGNGTIGKEIIKQIPDIDLIYVPIGSGALSSGVATAIKEINPHIKVIGVEPENAKTAFLSLNKGEIVVIDPPITIADGLRSLKPDTNAFTIMQKYLDDIIL